MRVGQRIGVAALARPTFDVPYATELAAQAFSALERTGWELVGGRELLFDAAAAQGALAALSGARLDALLLLQVTFTDATMTVEFSRAVDAPLTIWAFPEPRIGGRLRLNAFCGLNLALHALGRATPSPTLPHEGGESRSALPGSPPPSWGRARKGVDPGWLYAAPDATDIVERLRALQRTPFLALPHEGGGNTESADQSPPPLWGRAREGASADFSRADAVLARLRGKRIGLVGEHPAGFDTCRYDEGELHRLAGLDVEKIALPDLFALARAVPPDVVARDRAALAQQVVGLDALDQPQLDRSLSVYEALKGLANDKTLAAVAVRCWPETFTEYGCAACAPMGMLTEEGTPCACEADVYGALSALMLQEIAGEPAWLVDIVDIDVADGTGVLWHCGSAPISMRDPAVPVEAQIHTNRKMPLLRQFTLKPGRVTLARLSQARNETALIVGGGEVIRRPMAFTGTSAVLRFDGRAEAALSGLLDGALEHHLAIVYGDHEGTLWALGERLGIPVRGLAPPSTSPGTGEVGRAAAGRGPSHVTPSPTLPLAGRESASR